MRRNKASAVCLVIASFALILAGCRFNSSKKISNDKSSVAATEASTEASSTPQSLTMKDMFIGYADQVDKLEFTDCKNNLAGIDYHYDIVEPDNENNGTVTIYDSNGFHLHLVFSKNTGNKDTLALVSYNNGDYEGAVSDLSHADKINYSIYDINATPKNQTVDSLDEVVGFIFDKVPSMIADKENEPTQSAMINVQLNADCKPDNGKASFEITTNLPDETKLMLTLKNDSGYMGQASVIVDGGIAKSESFSDKGKALKGDYTLEVTMGLPKLQASSVTDVIGMHGEYLTGDCVTKASSGNDNKIKKSFPITIK